MSNGRGRIGRTRSDTDDEIELRRIMIPSSVPLNAEDSARTRAQHANTRIVEYSRRNKSKLPASKA